MNTESLLRHASMTAALLFLAIGAAVSDEPISEPVVTCPCAEDFATAIATYDARPGIPSLPAWSVCSVPRGSVGKHGTMMAKFDALSPAETGRDTSIHLNAARRWTLWGTHPVECSAWVYVVISPTKMKSLFNPTVRDGLSDAELSACETLIREIAQCPE